MRSINIQLKEFISKNSSRNQGDMFPKWRWGNWLGTSDEEYPEKRRGIKERGSAKKEHPNVPAHVNVSLLWVELICQSAEMDKFGLLWFKWRLWTCKHQDTTMNSDKWVKLWPHNEILPKLLPVFPRWLIYLLIDWLIDLLSIPAHQLLYRAKQCFLANISLYFWRHLPLFIGACSYQFPFQECIFY